MNFRGVLPSLVLSSCVLLTAQQGPKPISAADYSNEALVFEHLDTSYRMHADGTGERDLHVVMRVQSDGAAQQFGVLSFAYAAANESPSFKFVRVHKADGSTVETPPADAIEMPAAVSREAPLYSDLKEKQLPVRSLARGDTIEYEVDTIINKPEAPGHFWGIFHFTPPASVIVLAETFSLEVPADKYVQVWSPNHPPAVATANGMRTYSWKSAQLVSAPRATGDPDSAPTPPKDPDEDGDGRKLPSVAWTTFRNWAEVGDWYRALAQPAAQPNDALTARANDLTASAKTPEEQVRAIYDYVASHTRYVGIDFGIGRYKPHTAMEVLANQYGDCKDKDTLLQALLHAKGFSTASALIGVGIAPVPEVPSPAEFNHVITTVNLPGGRIWLDSTPLAAPYRYLSAELRDEKALLMPSDEPASLVSTPAQAPYAFTERFEAIGTLDEKGKMTAKMTATYRDDSELIVRSLARSIGPAEWDKASQYVSSNTGFGGTTSNTHFTNADDPSQPIVLTYDYLRNPFGDWDNLRIVPLFPALQFSALSKKDKEPESDIQLGAPRTLVTLVHIRLPQGYRTDLPDPIHVKTDFATFDKTYRFADGEIIVERNIVVLKEKLPHAEWERYKKFTSEISLDGEPWIQLIKPPAKIAVNVVPPPPAGKGVKIVRIEPGPSAQPAPPPAKPVATDASINDLMAAASTALETYDWTTALANLDAVKAKEPTKRGLWAMYGFIAEAFKHDLPTAIEDYRKELGQQPDNSMLALALAKAQGRNGDSAGERKTLQNFLEAHPDNSSVALHLATEQTEAGDDKGALKTLATAADHNPDDRNLRIQQGEALIRLGRNEEATAVAKSALDGADDPETLNDAAYVLSEAGTDLDLAEQSARKGIDKLEELSAHQSAAEVNSSAFARANLLVASWDTFGWILFREGKLAEARDWLAPAWRASQRPEIGDHLAQLEEAQNHKDEAATTYALAQAAIHGGNATPQLRDHIRDSMRRLAAAKAKPGPSNTVEALQNLRTFQTPRPPDIKGWGTFRVEITSTGVVDSQLVSGNQNIAKIKTSLENMKFAGLIPPASKAHLLRSAVVSCTSGLNCEVVLVPDGNLNSEQQ